MGLLKSKIKYFDDGGSVSTDWGYRMYLLQHLRDQIDEQQAILANTDATEDDKADAQDALNYYQQQLAKEYQFETGENDGLFGNRSRAAAMDHFRNATSDEERAYWADVIYRNRDSEYYNGKPTEFRSEDEFSDYMDASNLYEDYVGDSFNYTPNSSYYDKSANPNYSIAGDDTHNYDAAPTRLNAETPFNRYSYIQNGLRAFHVNKYADKDSDTDDSNDSYAYRFNGKLNGKQGVYLVDADSYVYDETGMPIGALNTDKFEYSGDTRYTGNADYNKILDLIQGFEDTAAPDTDATPEDHENYAAQMRRQAAREKAESDYKAPERKSKLDVNNAGSVADLEAKRKETYHNHSESAQKIEDRLWAENNASAQPIDIKTLEGDSDYAELNDVRKEQVQKWVEAYNAWAKAKQTEGTGRTVKTGGNTAKIEDRKKADAEEIKKIQEKRKNKDKPKETPAARKGGVLRRRIKI